MGFGRFLIARAVNSVAVVLIVALLAFFIIRLAPGDPAMFLAGEAATPKYLQTIRAAYGLNKPLTDQLWIYFTKLLQGNLGYSITYASPVSDVIMTRLPATILLVGTGISVALVVGIVLGVVSAKKPYGARDRLIHAASIFLYSTPVFVVGLVVIFLFTLTFPIFPTGGMGIDFGVTDPFAIAQSVGWHLVLPMLTISTFFLATYTLLTRAGLVESMSSNYITMARSKGLTENTILYRHALKNAMLPVITVAGIQFGLMVTGAVLTESIFSWPGIGSLLLQAVSTRDYSLVTGIFIVTAISVAVANFVADVIYTLVDPRLTK